MNSTHTAQLQESLHETRRSLERSHHAHEVTERSRRQLEAKLEDFQKRYDEMVGAKHTLESQQLGLEHEVRQMQQSGINSELKRRPGFRIWHKQVTRAWRTDTSIRSMN